jgi:3-dehydroquinate synthase
MTWTINTSQPVKFTIDIVPNVLSTVFNAGRTIVVIDSTVYELYKHLLHKDVTVLVIECDESTKDIVSAEKILAFFDKKQVLRRSEPVYAIGGGVLLDLVGYACSIYRRGIPYIRVPTTLLAIVDASVGAKTGINHYGRRNRLGSYYPPISTLIDTKFIATQDKRQIANGLAEILKLALVLDKQLYCIIEKDVKLLIDHKFQIAPAMDVIKLAISGMIGELQNNLWERDLERSVDYGHTFSPAIEMANCDTMLHGEAVILDCLLCCCISFNRNLMSDGDLTSIFKTVHNCNLPTYNSAFENTDILLSGLRDVMNHRDNAQNIPLVTTIGKHVIVNDITDTEIIEATALWKTKQY